MEFGSSPDLLFLTIYSRDDLQKRDADSHPSPLAHLLYVRAARWLLCSAGRSPCSIGRPRTCSITAPISIKRLVRALRSFSRSLFCRRRFSALIASIFTFAAASRCSICSKRLACSFSHTHPLFSSPAPYSLLRKVFRTPAYNPQPT